MFASPISTPLITTPVFFFPWNFSVCPWNFLKKCPWQNKKCPWQKTPNCARENGRVDRDKIAQNMPVKNEKWPWKFLQFCPWQNKKCPWQTIGFLSKIFSHQLKLQFFFLLNVHLWFIHSTKPGFFFFPEEGGKRQLLFC